MKFEVQLVLVTQVCVYLFALKIAFFFGSIRPEVLLGEGALEVCSDRPCRDKISMKLQSSFDEIALSCRYSPVRLLRIFGVSENASGGLFLLFCFVMNPSGEIKIHLDVSLWSLER